MFKHAICSATVILCMLAVSGCTSLKSDGHAALKAGNLGAAKQCYTAYLQERPDDWKTRTRLAYVYLQQKDYDNAIKETEAVLAASLPDRSRSWAVFYNGLAWLNKGQRAKAITVWQDYRNKFNRSMEKMVKAEIARQQTLLLIEESEAYAKKTVANENALQTIALKPDSLAVFYFENTTQDEELEAVKKALSAMISTDLAKVDGLTVIERIRMQALLKEMELADNGLSDSETAPKAGRLLGAEKLVAGTLTRGSIQVTPSLMHIPDQSVVGSFTVKRPVEEFFELEKDVVFHLLKLLGIIPTPEQRDALGEYYTRNYEAFIYYGKGLAALDNKQFGVSAELFAKAVEADPEFDLAVKALISTPTGENDSGISETVVQDMIQTLGKPKENSKCGN